jgi:hypothetical protein
VQGETIRGPGTHSQRRDSGRVLGNSRRGYAYACANKFQRLIVYRTVTGVWLTRYRRLARVQLLRLETACAGPNGLSADRSKDLKGPDGHTRDYRGSLPRTSRRRMRSSAEKAVSRGNAAFSGTGGENFRGIPLQNIELQDGKAIPIWRDCKFKIAGEGSCDPSLICIQSMRV